MYTFFNRRMAALAALATFALVLPFAALAATPESGTLTIESGPVEFSSGPNVGVNLTPLAEATCLDVLLPCDHFALTIDFPDNIGDFYPSALVRMSFSWDDPTGAGADDYDIYMFDAAGKMVNEAGTTNNPEVMTQLAVGGVKDYSFEVLYFTVLGSTYTGKIELDLGEPAEGVETEEFWMQNSLLARVLTNGDTSESESANQSVQRRSAGGALSGSALLMVLLAGFARSRRKA